MIHFMMFFLYVGFIKLVLKRLKMAIFIDCLFADTTVTLLYSSLTADPESKSIQTHSRRSSRMSRNKQAPQSDAEAAFLRHARYAVTQFFIVTQYNHQLHCYYLKLIIFLFIRSIKMFKVALSFPINKFHKKIV